MTPVLVVVVSHFWVGGEKATLQKAAGVAFGVAGAALLISGGADIGVSDWRFAVLAIAGPLSYAIALNIAARLQSFNPVVTTSWAMTCGAAAIAPFAWRWKVSRPWPTPRSWSARVFWGLA